MGEPIWCDCGAVLVESVSEEGVTPIGGEPIVFRRDTDFVVRASNGEFRAPALVVATGGLSIPKIGATSFGYGLARDPG